MVTAGTDIAWTLLQVDFLFSPFGICNQGDLLETHKKV